MLCQFVKVYTQKVWPQVWFVQVKTYNRLQETLGALIFVTLIVWRVLIPHLQTPKDS